ncbi:MAG: terminase family protein [Pseudomonadota bacterium]
MSYYHSICNLPEDARAAFFDSLTPEEAQLLEEEFIFKAHNHQFAPHEDYTSWLLMGGRGAGKTRAGAEAVIRAARYEGAMLIALVGETITDVVNIMVNGVSGIMNCAPEDFKPVIKRSENHIVFPNGAKAYFFSSTNPSGLRGPQFHFAWCDELAKWHYVNETWDMLQMALRLGENPRQIVTTTPRPLPLLHELVEDKDTVTTTATSYDNRDHLSPKFFEKIITKYQNTRFGRQEIEGVLMEGYDAALWNRADLDRQRIAPEKRPEHFERIVVAVDPPVSNHEGSDECGIIVAGSKPFEKDGQITYKSYVLADYSVRGMSPHGWAEQVIRAYHDHQADRIVAESNQGGEMVQSILRSIDPHIPYRAVWARRGKITRAEPIAALYEQDMVHHVGYFPELEDQMCCFTLDNIFLPKARSPDRVDALVWAITELVFKAPHAIPNIHTL